MKRTGNIWKLRMPCRVNSRQAYLKEGGNVSKKSAGRGNRACGFLSPGYGLQRERHDSLSGQYARFVRCATENGLMQGSSEVAPPYALRLWRNSGFRETEEAGNRTGRKSGRRGQENFSTPPSDFRLFDLLLRAESGSKTATDSAQAGFPFYPYHARIMSMPS